MTSNPTERTFNVSPSTNHPTRSGVNLYTTDVADGVHIQRFKSPTMITRVTPPIKCYELSPKMTFLRGQGQKCAQLFGKETLAARCRWCQIQLVTLSNTTGY